jgi:feruloyl esterase
MGKSMSEAKRASLAVCGSVMLVMFGARAATAATSCESLAKLHAGNMTIITAASVDGLSAIAPELAQAGGSMPLCRVNGFLTPTRDSRIGFEIWLPPAASWNHKIESVGNGGFSGALNYRAMLPAFTRGYATLTTDLGHTNTPPTAVEDATWALGHPEKVVDYAYRAEHLSTLAAKRILREFYGVTPMHSYYNGCSAGGIQGMTEVLRYPTDYDGYIIGDATADHLGQEMGALWNTLAGSLADPPQPLKPAQMSLVHQEILRQCVGKDGGAPSDTFLTDPPACHFEPKTLQCSAGQDSSSCLTPEQVGIFEKIYQGPVEPRTHEALLSGITPGAELMWDRFFTGKKNPVSADRPWAGFLTYMVYSDPEYLTQQKYLTFDFDKDYQAVRRQRVAGESLDSSWNTRSRDLQSFQRAGGKVIHYHGWDDPNIPALEAVKFFQSVIADQARRNHLSTQQAIDATQRFYRLFMVSGMGHCAGGDGPSSFGQNGQRGAHEGAEYDTLSALERWVETGVAPEQFIGSRVDAKTHEATMTRPICAYPQSPVWNGSGNSTDAGSFACIENARARASLNPGPL